MQIFNSSQSEAETVLQRLDVFRELPEALLQRLARRARLVTFSPTETIVRRGEVSSTFYVIVNGEVEVTLSDSLSPSGVRTLARRQEGEFFGEVAVLHNLPRTADIKALTYTRLLALERAEFLELLEAGQKLHQSLQTVAAERLQTTVLAA
jgi:CRP-like cAMP-binding protein